MTGCTRIDEWIAYRAPTGIYMFNLIGSDPPLKGLGFSADPAEMLSSVSYESYRRCIGDVWGNMRKKKGMIELEEGQITM